MRIRFAAVALSVAPLFACGGGEGLGTVNARAWFEPEAIDFGMLRAGDSKEERVQLMATGFGNARVDAVTFDVHGDAYSARTPDKTLLGSFLSGNSPTEVLMIFGPNEEGELDSTMTVRIGEAEATLALAGSARSRVPATPEVAPSSINFGEVELGRNASERFSLVNSGEDEGRLREVRPKSVGEASPFGVTRRGGGDPVPMDVAPDRAEEIDLEAHFAPTVVGSFSEDLELIFEGGAKATLKVRGEAVPAGALTCEESSLDFGSVERGGSTRRTVHCEVTGGRFTVARIGPTGTSSPLFSVPSPPSGASSGRLDFEVQFDARGVALEHSGVVEVVSVSGATTRIEVKAAVIPPTASTTDLSVSLTWSTDQTDFDLHLVRGSGAPFDGVNDCYYAAKNPDWGVAEETLDDPFLDNDNTRGFGPEQINLTTAAEDTFDVFVHFYDYGAARPPPTELTMRISVLGNEVGTYTQTLDFCGGTWHVGQVRFNETPPRFVPDTLITSAYRSRAATRCQ